jgi:hypothetical protein
MWQIEPQAMWKIQEFVKTILIFSVKWALNSAHVLEPIPTSSYFNPKINLAFDVSRRTDPALEYLCFCRGPLSGANAGEVPGSC